MLPLHYVVDHARDNTVHKIACARENKLSATVCPAAFFSVLLGCVRCAGNLVCHQNFNKVAIALRESYEMDKDIAEHLCHNYGTRALQLAEMATREPVGRVRAQSATCESTFFWKRLSPQHPQLQAEVIFAIRHEYAETAVDVSLPILCVFISVGFTETGYAQQNENSLETAPCAI
eukprot:m.608082 g.608082  ORF g.608082 m.608082 type:complete len:176 (+) comp22484_c2_seq5:1795-2322(+)